ncbi:MAG: outer membrane protein assembly factor BamA [Alphaproteobacteria bacterium]|nr:outer membrane protein assembly factor BamA [Alphaproteobacteria bacterium]OJV12243.1 MAG: outer membrane protein assembly factor BamA [Alphaproteobacteria bacterium 33-17]
MIKRTIILLSLLSTSANCYASVIVKGNKRVDADTILVHGGINVANRNAKLDESQIDIAIKKLYETGLFKKISASNSANDTIINVEENPMIHTLVIEGNRRIKNEEILPELILSERSIYNILKVQKDVETIQRLYQKTSRYAVKVHPKIIELPGNKVNLVYEITEGGRTLIGNIHFVGNSVVSNGKLKDVINSKEDALFRFFSTGPSFDIDKVNYDKELITRFYQSRGYADVEIKTPVVELDSNQNCFDVTFIINEGKQYKFGDISIESEIEAVNAENLKKFAKVRKGSTFDNTEIEDITQKITDYLGDQGFAFVDVEPEMDKTEDTINIKLIIRNAPKYYVNKINIKGNLRTYDKVIRREMKVTEGDAFKASEITAAEQKIKDLDFFETVEVDIKPLERSEDKVDIDVEVKEKSTGSMNFAVGISDLQGAVAKIVYSESNFTGRGQKIRLSATKTKRDTDFELNFTEPYFLDYDLSTGFDADNLFKDKSKERSFTSHTRSFSLRAGYDLTDHLSHALYYKIRKEKIGDLDNNASILLREQQGDNTLSVIGHGFNFNTLDSKVYPTKGLNISLSQDLAGLGGSTAFMRHEFKSSAYVPVYKEDVVLQLTASAGQVNSIRDKKILATERYFLGGDTVRGFKDYGFGPRDKTTGEALGGNAFYSAKAQLSFPIGLPKELDVKGLVFSDFGSLYKLDYKNYAFGTRSSVNDTNRLRASFGTGLIWNSPAGAISVSLANPFKKEHFDKERKFRFSILSEF